MLGKRDNLLSTNYVLGILLTSDDSEMNHESGTPAVHK